MMPIDHRPKFNDFPAPGVQRLKHCIVNSYILSEPGGRGWFLVDAGLSRFSIWKILRNAARRFGPDRPPRAVILTHAHFDHVGALIPLLRRWDVPVYAHARELPFLTGAADYQPPDPGAGGGAMAWLAFMYPRNGLDLTGFVQELPEDGSIPGLDGWRWVHTPGHTPGHVSLFRFVDRLVIAGDAFITVKQESFWAVLTQKQRVHGPPSYFTPDWNAARQSVRNLMELDPEIAATGHGKPIRGMQLHQQLEHLATHFNRVAIPAHGKYVSHPMPEPAFAH